MGIGFPHVGGQEEKLSSGCCGMLERCIPTQGNAAFQSLAVSLYMSQKLSVSLVLLAAALVAPSPAPTPDLLLARHSVQQSTAPWARNLRPNAPSTLASICTALGLHGGSTTRGSTPLADHLLAGPLQRPRASGSHLLGPLRGANVPDPLGIGPPAQRRAPRHRVLQVQRQELLAEPRPELLHGVEVWAPRWHMPRRDPNRLI